MLTEQEMEELKPLDWDRLVVIQCTKPPDVVKSCWPVIRQWQGRVRGCWPVIGQWQGRVRDCWPVIRQWQGRVRDCWPV